MKSYSLNEIETLVKKSARGAGYDWGRAEEAGFAAAQLHRIGIDGSAAVTQLVDIMSKSKIEEHRPFMMGNNLFSGQFGCPITIGCYILDNHDEIQFDGLNIDTVVVPILLLPFITCISLLEEQNISVKWNSLCFNVMGNVIERVTTEKETNSFYESANIELHYANTPGILMERCTRAKVVDENITKLEGLASKIYAPVTAESRLKGAG